MAVEEKEKNIDQKLEEFNKKISPAYLIKLHKLKLAEKINKGEVNLVEEFKQLEQLEKKAAMFPSPQSSPQRDKTDGEIGGLGEEDDDYGIPERLRVRRPYTLSAAALEQRKNAASSPAKSEAMQGNKNAWKTGEYAQGLIRQIFRPCKSICSNYLQHRYDFRSKLPQYSTTALDIIEDIFYLIYRGGCVEGENLFEQTPPIPALMPEGGVL